MGSEVTHQLGEVGISEPVDVTGSITRIGRVEVRRKNLNCAGRIATDMSEQ